MRIVGFAALVVASLLRLVPIFVALLLCGNRRYPGLRVGIVAGFGVCYVALHRTFLGHWNLFSTASAILTQQITGEQSIYLPLSLLIGLALALLLGAALGRSFRPKPLIRAGVLGISCALSLAAIVLLDAGVTAPSQLQINEVCGSSLESDKDYIELYNGSAFACDLKGLYLSDSAGNPTKKQLPEELLPGNSYLLIPLSPASFGIKDEGGEEILLSDGQGNILDSVTTAPVRAGYAYARCNDGSSAWAELSATPGKSNNDAHSPEAHLPVFSHPGGFYLGEFDLTITADRGDTIYYTLDGSVPTTRSAVYKKPLRVYDKSSEPNEFRSIQRVVSDWKNYKPYTKPVDKAFIVRAIAVSKDGVVSEPVTATYFVNLDKYQNQTVLSLVVDPDEMWGVNGIGVTGIEYDSWYEGSKKGTAPTANFRRRGRAFEIEGALSYFSDTARFDQQIGVRINGGSARNGALKRLALYARTAYSGTEYFTEMLLGDFQSRNLVLRDSAFNVIAQLMVSDRDVAIQRAKPVTVFLNGEYWYKTNLIEKYDATYFQEHYGIDPDNIIICKAGELEEGVQGDTLFWDEAYAFLRSHDMSDPENYAQFGQILDIQSYIDFLCINLYIDNMDFDGYKNVVVWKARMPADDGYADGKWRYALYDVEAMEWKDASKFGLETQAEKNPFELTPRFAQPLHKHVIYSHLMKNEQFRKQFVTTFQDLVNNEYVYENVEQAFLRYSRKLPDKYYADFFRARSSYMLPYMAEEFDLNGTQEKLVLRTNEPKGGEIRLNTITPDLTSGFWTGRYYTDYPITLTAVAAEGYRFVGWEGIDSSDSTATVTLQKGGLTIRAVFEKIP